MAETTATQQIVERVVSEVLQGQVSRLREELVRRVVEELPEQTGGPAHVASAGGGGAGALLKAVAAIQAGTTQREILRALLDNMVRYSGRAALFVIKSGAATGWQSRGFAKGDEDPVKDFALDAASGIAGRALQSRTVFAGTAEEMDTRFISQFDAPPDDRVLVLPLVLKEKVAALVYADAGTEASGKMDAAALELLVLTASAWLEVTSLRKQSQKESMAAGPAIEKAESTAAAAPQTPAFSDPFASHAPKHAAAAAGAAGATETATMTEVVAVSTPSDVPLAAAVQAVPANADAAMLPEDADTHAKAQRFARLLVDEIKLYNQAKVAEGRKHKDLYDRLKDDIEKSRATYQKRYGNTAAANGDYFSHELVRSLAEDDRSIMGANFRR
jgi:hypothetical protein